MLLWFAGLAPPAVAAVFASRAVDYRLVLAGAVLPSLDLVVPGAGVLNTLLLPTALLAAVMILGWGRRLVQRRWLGLPIGLFCHLILDGAWARPGLFWWPLGGGRLEFGAVQSLRPLWAIILMEVAGALALVWWWRRFGLHDAARRGEFRRRGRLMPPPQRDRRR